MQECREEWGGGEVTSSDEDSTTNQISDDALNPPISEEDYQKMLRVHRQRRARREVSQVTACACGGVANCARGGVAVWPSVVVVVVVWPTVWWWWCGGGGVANCLWWWWWCGGGGGVVVWPTAHGGVANCACGGVVVWPTVSVVV